MRVAIFSECLLPVVNGVSISVLTLARFLRVHGDEVYIFAPAYRGYQETDPFTVRLPSFKVPKQPDYPLAFPFSLHARQVLREHPPEVVHVNSPFTMARFGARVARKRKAPWVVTYHTLLREYAHYAPLVGARIAPFLVRVSRDFCNSADAVIAPSGPIRDELRNYGVTTPIHVIPTGIPPDKKPSDDPSWVRKQWNVPAEAPLLIYTGRLAKEKRIEVLLNAFALVAKEVPEAVLLVVGGGPFQQETKDLVASLSLEEKVRLAGFQQPEKIMDYLAASDVFVTASDTETQGLNLLEAMRAGVPAVAVDAYGTGETVRQTGGGLLSTSDAEAFAAQVLRLLREPELRRELAAKGRTGAEEFTSDKCAAKVRALYASLVG